MKTTNPDWRYIAGFFDGEGSVTKNASGWRISVPQTHRGVLMAILRSSKIGSVFHVAKRQAHWRESWTYAISRQQDVNAFLRNVAPFLIVKRKIAHNVLRFMPDILDRQRQRRALAESRRQSVDRLRKLGYSYRVIGQRLSLDWGYVRRVFLRGDK